MSWGKRPLYSVRKPISRVQLVLAAALVATAIGIAVGFLEISASGNEIRDESAEVLELQRIAAALGQLRQSGERVAGGHTEIATADRGLLRSQSVIDDTPVRVFGDAYQQLLLVSDDPEQVDALGATWRQYVGALDGLPGPSVGADAIGYYHQAVLPAQAEVEAALIEFQRSEGDHLRAAIDASVRADTWLRTLLPLLLSLALLLAASIVWLQRQRRRQEHDRLVTQNREKDEFIASVSHELRTPLTSVIGFLEMLRYDDPHVDVSERPELIAIAAQEAADLAYLVEDLLVVAKAQADGLSAVRVGVSLRSQVAQVLESLAAQDTIEVTGSAPAGTGDPARLRQVLRNLVTNARRYGGHRIEVRLSERDGHALVAVADDGAGVAPEDESRIFEPYQRAHSVPGVAGSVGLGLTVCRQLIELMGGTLQYRRESGWTVFEVALPIHEDAAESEVDSRQRIGA